MAKLTELATILDAVSTSLNAVSDQLVKATAEIIAAFGDVEIPADAQAKLDGLKTLAETLKSESQKLDDLNPDKTP